MPQENYRRAFKGQPKPNISYGLAFPEACTKHIDETLHANKVYVIVSNSISKTDNFSRLQTALGDRIVGIRKGIRPHTPWNDVLEIVKEIDDLKADSIVTLGAGSLTDGAKLISFALANNVSTTDDLEKMYACGSRSEKLSPCKIPVINIPTSLSGGEYSHTAGSTDERTSAKYNTTHESMGAHVIILDPELSISTPAKIWLSTGMRAVDHCVESLCTLSKKLTPEIEATASQGLAKLARSLLKTKENWEDLDARLESMLGVIDAMTVFSSGVPLGGSHGIGHQLGPLGVGHGETSCVMLPAVLRWNYKNGDENVRARQKKVIEALWSDPTLAEKLEQGGLKKEDVQAGDVIDAIVAYLEMPKRMKDVGVGRDKLDLLAENSLKDRCLPTNPIPLTEKEQVLEILELALE